MKTRASYPVFIAIFFAGCGQNDGLERLPLAPLESPCEPEPDAVLCGAMCGDQVVTDRCGEARPLSCRSCAADEQCLDAVCVCQPESDAELCDAASAACGQISATDRCGNIRIVPCGCCAETDDELCALFGKDCDTLSTRDSCGTLRAAPCGVCSPGSCVDNVCFVGCTPTTDCDAEGAECGDIDNGCATISCGGCAATHTCITGTCVCTPTVTACNGMCGSVADGCGGFLACGGCAVGSCGPDNRCDACPPGGCVTQSWDWHDLGCNPDTTINCDACGDVCPYVTSPNKPWSCNVSLTVATSATYNVWMYALQGFSDGKHTDTVNIDLDGYSWIVGAQETCPSCWAWENLGTAFLSAGTHTLRASDTPLSIGAWSLGSLMLTTYSGPISSCTPP